MSRCKMGSDIWIAGLYFLLLIPGAWAEVIAEDAYLRELPPNSPVSAVFLTLRNTGATPKILTGAYADIADRVEIHAHLHESGKMLMRPVAQVEVPARGEVGFQPGGYHIMLFGLQRRVVAGDILSIVLKFAGGEQITVKAMVRKL